MDKLNTFFLIENLNKLMMDNVVDWKEGFKNFAGRGAEVERYFGSYTYVYGIMVALMEIISEAVS